MTLRPGLGTAIARQIFGESTGAISKCDFRKLLSCWLLGFVLEGCAPALIPMDKDALARLPHQSEILAGHHSRPAPRPRPQSSYWLPTSPHPIGNAIGVGILLLQLAANNAAAAPSDYCWNDPVTKVKERFTAALNDQFGLANVRVIDRQSGPRRMRSICNYSTTFLVWKLQASLLNEGLRNLRV